MSDLRRGQGRELDLAIPEDEPNDMDFDRAKASDVREREGLTELSEGDFHRSAAPPESVWASFESARIFDLSELSEMLDNQKEVIDAVIQAFKESLVENSQSLTDVVEGGSDLNQIRFYSHSIKGSSIGSGAFALGEAAAKLEDACRREDALEVAETYPLVHDLIGRTIEALEKMGY
ncbi:MAG: Hpt domain-containing protein [Verrucomicrobiota bacterium]